MRSEKEWIIPIEDIPMFLSRLGFPLGKLAECLALKICFLSKPVIESFKSELTDTQYNEMRGRFTTNGKTFEHILGYSPDKFHQAKILYAINRYAQATTKGKHSEYFKARADYMQKELTEIDFSDPIRINNSQLAVLKGMIK